MKPGAMWQKRLILDPKDADQLDATAAEREFKDRLTRGQAEEATHKDYQQGKHREGAAFHLQGMRASQTIGQMDEAKKHGAMYIKHMKALGHDPVAEPPAEIKKLAESEDTKVYKFKGHAADQYVMEPQTSEKKEDAPMSEPKEMTKAEKVDAMWADLRKKEGVRTRLNTIAKAVGMLRKDELNTEKVSTPVEQLRKLEKSEPEKRADTFFNEKYQRDVGFTYDQRAVRKDEDTATAKPVVVQARERLAKEEAQKAATERENLSKSEKAQAAADVREKASKFFEGYGNTPGFSYES